MSPALHAQVLTAAVAVAVLAVVFVAVVVARSPVGMWLLLLRAVVGCRHRVVQALLEPRAEAGELAKGLLKGRV